MAEMQAVELNEDDELVLEEMVIVK